MDSQSANASSHIYFKSKNLIFFSFVQPLNTNGGKLSLNGLLKPFNLRQFINAPSNKLGEEFNNTSSRFSHSQKAYFPITCTEAGKSMLFNCLQP